MSEVVDTPKAGPESLEKPNERGINTHTHMVTSGDGGGGTVRGIDDGAFQKQLREELTEATERAEAVAVGYRDMLSGWEAQVHASMQSLMDTYSLAEERALNSTSRIDTLEASGRRVERDMSAIKKNLEEAQEKESQDGSLEMTKLRLASLESSVETKHAALDNEFAMATSGISSVVSAVREMAGKGLKGPGEVEWTKIQKEVGELRVQIEVGLGKGGIVPFLEQLSERVEVDPTCSLTRLHRLYLTWCFFFFFRSR